jgi:putative redox protein
MVQTTVQHATVHSESGLRAAINIRNHTLTADETLDRGGTDTAPTPMEMLLGALGACIVITIQMYAQRKNWPLEAVNVTLSLERFKKEDYPAYTGDAGFVNEIRQEVTLKGNLTDEQRARLLEIGNRCPVHRTLENPTFFVEGSSTSEGQPSPTPAD